MGVLMGVLNAVAFNAPSSLGTGPTGTTATLSGPTSGDIGVKSTAFAVTLNAAAPAGGFTAWIFDTAVQDVLTQS
jgi:hypothetical protein